MSFNTGLECEIDALIARLVELRTRPVVAERMYDDEPDGLRALAELLTDAARAVDPLLQRVSYESGLGSLSGASEYVGLASAAVEDLHAEIVGRAERIDEERAGEAQIVADRREHSTLNLAQQGVGR